MGVVTNFHQRPKTMLRGFVNIFWRGFVPIIKCASVDIRDFQKLPSG